jgi:hypothetical protein
MTWQATVAAEIERAHKVICDLTVVSPAIEWELSHLLKENSSKAIVISKDASVLEVVLAGTAIEAIVEPDYSSLAFQRALAAKLAIP